MELNSNALVSWEFVRDYSGKFQEAQKDKVTSLINWISSKAETIAQREIISKIRVLDICGNGAPRLYLPVTPITDVESIVIDNTHLFIADPVDATDYHVDYRSGIITRYNYLWPSGLFNIRVTYTAGWTIENMPADIQKACLEAINVAWNRQNDNSYGVTSKTTPDGMNIAYEPRLSPDVYGTFADLRIGLV
jgi:uncharacterized protein YbdZ (MbtH family)